MMLEAMVRLTRLTTPTIMFKDDIHPIILAAVLNQLILELCSDIIRYFNETPLDLFSHVGIAGSSKTELLARLAIPLFAHLGIPKVFFSAQTYVAASNTANIIERVFSHELFHSSQGYR